MYQQASFQTSVRGVRITKTYTLQPRWYHLGLEVRLELEDKTKEKEFRYQLTGAHGLPIEGEWYTSTFRNALIGRVDAQGKLGERFLQDLTQVAAKGGGDDVVAGANSLFYAGVAVQFFASVIAVDPRDKADTKFLERARPLLMESAIRGRIIKREGDDLTILDDTNKPRTLRFANQEDRKLWEPFLASKDKVVIVYKTEIDLKGNGRDLITRVLDVEQTIPLFQNDMTVAVTSRLQKLQPGVPVVHKYVLYNGPVKVMLLDQLKLDQAVGDLKPGAPAVDPALVAFYRDDLHLNTLTDFRSPGVLSDALSWTPWTTIIIFFTNLLHGVLYYLSYIMPVHGLCIVLLTVLVRGAMFPVSRKQALTSIRMQQLAPELKKLQEKHKGDRQAMAAAQMQLYRQYGVNPFGSCWLILLQMPVFLGLYYALQESIHFRLSSFLWIDNLAAPDMLIPWGSSIPWISKPQDYGWLLYLGPYFNILPVVAVALMIVQQKMTMPPPADDQAAMQMKMMKYMMIFMGLMFYKVAAGLCIYFIASSLWGFAERKLLPKRQKEPPPGLAVEPPKPGWFQRLWRRRGPLTTGKLAAIGEGTLAVGRPNGSTGSGSPVVPPSLPGRGKKKRQRDRKKVSRTEGAGSSPVGLANGNGFVPNLRSWWKQTGSKIRDWWKDLLRKAGKK
jgi:YidC/Oxa1 family membrane protein insertase